MNKIFLKLILPLIIFFIFIPTVKSQEIDSIFIIGKDILEIIGEMTEITDEEEIEYGDKIAEQFNLQNNLTDENRPYIERIGNSISKFVTRVKIKYKFRVIDNDSVINAFSMAGGNIWVTKGLLNLVENDDELAFVIAHEIAHEDKKHNMRRIQLIVKSGQIGGETAEYFAMIAQKLATLPFEKYQEFEADEWGVYLMYRAGYNTKGAIDFFKKLSKLEGDYEKEKDLGYIFRTHPYTSDRIKNLEKYIKENLK